MSIGWHPKVLAVTIAVDLRCLRAAHKQQQLFPESHIVLFKDSLRLTLSIRQDMCRLMRRKGVRVNI
jgi:hypothetical protein